VSDARSVADSYIASLGEAGRRVADGEWGVTIDDAAGWPLHVGIRLGDGFLREYLLPFELAGLVLLLALVGAMVLARRSLPTSVAVAGAGKPPLGLPARKEPLSP